MLATEAALPLVFLLAVVSVGTGAMIVAYGLKLIWLWLCPEAKATPAQPVTPERAARIAVKAETAPVMWKPKRNRGRMVVCICGKLKHETTVGCPH
jgi:hypothetical protein